jgi:formylglycine-generating enzyme required for sulfatase activity
MTRAGRSEQVPHRHGTTSRCPGWSTLVLRSAVMLRIAPIVILIVACGRKSDAPSSPGKDAERKAATASPDATAVDPDEPTIPPPEPTVKAGGKGDCRTEYAPRPTRDPNPMCKIAGGVFTMGTDEADLPDATNASKHEVPARRVQVSPFYLDQFEVTVAQVVHYLEAVPDNLCKNKYGTCFLTSQTSSSPISHEGAVATAEPGTERHPFTMATIEGAERYCRWAGKRLPTEAEWELAARLDPLTGKSFMFPWGDVFEPKRANCAEEDCEDGFREKAPVGSFDGTAGLLDGSSPWGVHDLAGNTSEVVADCFAPYSTCDPVCVDPLIKTETACKRALRGASWSGSRIRQRGATRQEATSATGFRCAR